MSMMLWMCHQTTLTGDSTRTFVRCHDDLFWDQSPAGSDTIHKSEQKICILSAKNMGACLESEQQI
ncbi:hypothetical protein FRX31_022802 [Thalictrum thalictroides]|uniref:Uncharacterized protein n=1 Tax=Thalictrum thalictroides TaxID=46969 RepID=A0A7J6VRA6_THATH|nr:hypothetical protein FRX31_022802 [Thalictrum thalictroides]